MLSFDGFELGRGECPGRASPSKGGDVKSHTAYMTFETGERQELIRITEEVQEAVDAAGVAEGMALVSAMHITAGVWVNDDEPGLHEDVLEWLDKVAPPSWKPAANEVAEELSKVSWPDRKEVTSSTTVVLFYTLFATVFFALMDQFWKYVTDKIYSF